MSWSKSINAAIGNELLVSKEETAGEELYEIIMMKKYPLPLLKWWGKPILSYALKEGLINAYSDRSFIIQNALKRNIRFRERMI